MTNNPQSSRRTALQSIYPKIKTFNTSTTFDENSLSNHYVTATPTSTGEQDVQIKKREKATGGHYILILGAIAVGLYLLNKKAGEY